MSKPPQFTALVGLLLVAVGVIAYFVSMPGASLTALIPAVVGLILAILGGLAISRENARKHLMHAAAGVALLGALGAAGQLIASPASGSDSAGVAKVAGILLLIGCVSVLVVAVRSFIAARKS